MHKDPIIFQKYKRWGGYHWRWYGKRFTYTRHVDFLKNWVKEKETIDIGAGDGLITNILGIYGIDNDPWAIKEAAKKGVKIDLGDAYNLPYSDEEFDSALLSDTIEHIIDTNLALYEARRVIKKYLYINIPTVEKFREADHHYHAWSPEEFITEVQSKGFKLIEGPLIKHHRNKSYFKFQKI